MFLVDKKNSIAYLESSLLKSCDFLTHAFCTRRGGSSRDDYKSMNMSFQEGDEEFRVLANWDKLATAFDIPLDNFLVLNQVHKDDILVIRPHGDYFTSREALNYDAVVTNRPDLAICIKTADCVPLFIVDRIKKVIAAVHAGRSGTAMGIGAKMVRLMRDEYGSLPADMLAAMGPCIGKCCYEVDTAAAQAFCGFTNAGEFLSEGGRRGKWMLDLIEANRRQLADSGLPADNIEASGLCTVCRKDAFFSYRGSGGITGRQINFMMIKGETPCRTYFTDDPGCLH
jgi:YfiH family protein